MADREWPSFDEDDWELYDTNKDWSQAHDLSKEMPEKLREMQYLFMIEAAKYGVFPLDDRRYERFNAAIAGRPDLPAGRKTMTFYAGMDTLMENTVLNVKNRSHTVTAEVEVAEGKTDGVIVAQGGRFAGWSLYVKDGKPNYCYNYFDVDYYTSRRRRPCPRAPSTSDTTSTSRASMAVAVPGGCTSTTRRSARDASRVSPLHVLRRRDPRHRWRLGHAGHRRVPRGRGERVPGPRELGPYRPGRRRREPQEPDAAKYQRMMARQ